MPRPLGHPPTLPTRPGRSDGSSPARRRPDIKKRKKPRSSCFLRSPLSSAHTHRHPPKKQKKRRHLPFLSLSPSSRGGGGREATASAAGGARRPPSLPPAPRGTAWPCRCGRRKRHERHGATCAPRGAAGRTLHQQPRLRRERHPGGAADAAPDASSSATGPCSSLLSRCAACAAWELALPVARVFFLSVDASGSARTPGLYAGDCFLFLLRPVLPPPHPLSLGFYLCATDWASLQSKVPPMCASRPFHCRLSRPALYVPPSLTFRFRLNLTMCLFFNSDFRTSSSQLRSHRDDNFGQTSILLSDASISHMDFIPTQYFLLIQVLSQ